jgi:hypothetical protein
MYPLIKHWPKSFSYLFSENQNIKYKSVDNKNSKSLSNFFIDIEKFENTAELILRGM